MGTLILQLILAVDIAALTWLFLWYGQRRVVAAFRDREMRLLMGLAQGVVVVDGHGDVVAMNEEARSLFSGHDIDQEVNIEKRLPLFFEDGKCVRMSEHPFHRAFDGKRSIPPSKRWVKRGTDLVPVSISAAFVPSFQDASSAVVGLVQDISREELMERMKSDFIGIASHQLRSPMASLKWYGEMLTKDVEGLLPKAQREYLHRMNDATQRMISLVDDFLSASRFETYGDTMHEDKISVTQLLRHIVETQDLLIQSRHLSVRVSQEGTIRPVYADPAMLREVLANFVANAVKYNRIHVIDSYIVCSSNPVTFVEGLTEMVKILHPMRKKE